LTTYFKNNSVRINMCKDPLISIVIPTWRSPYTLSRVLEAVANIDYPEKRIEVIIVNDEADSDTENVVKEFECRYSNKFLRVIYEKNSVREGVSRARNKGIMLSKGEYILLLDDDVLPDPGVIRRLLEHFRVHPNLGAVTALYLHKPPSLPELLSALPYLGSVRETHSRLGTGSCIIPRHVIEKVGLFNEKLGYPYTVYEDWEYGVRIRKAGFKLLIDGRVVLHHLHRPRASTTLATATRSSTLRILKALLSYLRPRKGFELYMVIRHSRRLQLEYSMYILWMSSLVILALFQPFLFLIALLAPFIAASTYYAFLSRAAVKIIGIKRMCIYVPLLSLAVLASRSARSIALLLYLLMYNTRFKGR